ncbi:MAG: iron-containing alcohol dehydrogenase [Bacteroidaceae bacterium]|jgi:alcohol dehydrogenase YqhD (iron-dependent ADH family)|nr:iron-containing alcohol dehydrogenase [Bacteroidaceae bacterium]
MRDFIYHTPTEVVFGEQSEEQVARLVKKYGGTKVLVHYGGQSALRSGLLDKIFQLLTEGGVAFVKLGGVVPNPRLSLAQEGIALCRKESVDFILAVGGGSVIDSAKCIAYGVCYDGDVWDFYLGKAKPQQMLPVGTVLTIPAAGSEMSEASVITNEDGDVKLGYSNDMSRPKFAIMNPRRSFTLPPYQTAAGVTDMIMHTMERYFTRDDDMDLTTDIAEAIMRRMKTAVYDVLRNPEDYRARTQIMWGGSLAHNGLTGCGISDDWATHQLEHELSGMFDVTHGAGLAAIWPSWARYVMHENLSRFVRFAVNVMDVPNDFTDPETVALKGIEAMERFYHDIGMPVNIRELIGRDITDDEIREMARKCSRDYTTTCGCLKVLHAEDMEAIYRMARG